MKPVCLSCALETFSIPTFPRSLYQKQFIVKWWLAALIEALAFSRLGREAGYV